MSVTGWGGPRRAEEQWEGDRSAATVGTWGASGKYGISPASSCVEMDRFSVSSTKTTRALTALRNCLLESVRIWRLKVARLTNCLVSVLAVVNLHHRRGGKQPKGVPSSQMDYGG